jgi:hypothetical protein
MIAHEDMLQATGVFLLYVALPGIVVLLVGRLTHAWDRLMQAAPWLLSPT